MVALSCDDDGASNNHEVYLHDQLSGAGTAYHATPFRSGNNDTDFAIISTTSVNGISINGGSAPANLPTTHVIPASIYIQTDSGGGVAWGYEDDHILVK